MIGENAMKDSELIQKVHSGNKEAVGIIIERYYADIYRFCLYMVQTEVFPKQKDIKKQPMFTCLQTKEYCY